MKRVFRTCAILCCLSVPITSNSYMYDNNPDIGYVVMGNDPVSRTTHNSAHKVFFTQPYSPSYQKSLDDHNMDGHFKERKNSVYHLQPTPAHKVIELPKATEVPVQWKPRKPMEENEERIMRKTSGASPQAPASQEVKPTPETKLNINVYKVHNTKNNPVKPQQKYDKKFDQSFVEVNVKKKDVSSEPQKIVLSNNRQSNPLSLQGVISYRHRVPTSSILDKSLHVSAKYGDRNTQVMYRILEDLTQKITDRRQHHHKKRQFMKRETKLDKITKISVLKNDLNSDNRKIPHSKELDMPKRGSVSENIIKYIGKTGKETNIHVGRDRKNYLELLGTRTYENSLPGVPYALFYRMNPDASDHQDEVIVFTSIEGNSNSFVHKEQRLPENSEDGRKSKPKKNSNTVKYHKVKNFPRFRGI